MGDILPGLLVLTAGFLPLIARAFVRSRTALLIGFGWLLVVGIFLLRPAANDPHAFGLVIFSIFLVVWLGAMGIVWINRDQVSKEANK